MEKRYSDEFTKELDAIRASILFRSEGEIANVLGAWCESMPAQSIRRRAVESAIARRRLE